MPVSEPSFQRSFMNFHHIGLRIKQRCRNLVLAATNITPLCASKCPQESVSHEPMVFASLPFQSVLPAPRA
eukprot:1192018-Amphidinium_carterae.1